MIRALAESFLDGLDDGLDQRRENSARKRAIREKRGDPWARWQAWLCALGFVVGLWLAGSI